MVGLLSFYFFYLSTYLFIQQTFLNLQLGILLGARTRSETPCPCGAHSLVEYTDEQIRKKTKNKTAMTPNGRKDGYTVFR